jgi:hypothetical protein
MAVGEELTSDEMAVLMEMSDDLGYTAAQISADLHVQYPNDGWTPRRVSTIRRSLHAKGYADFGPLVGEDDGLLRGRGYTVSAKGCAIRFPRAAGATA